MTRLELIRDVHQKRHRLRAESVEIEPAWRAKQYRDADRNYRNSDWRCDHDRRYSTHYERVLFAVLNGLSEVLQSPPPGY